MVPQSWNRYAYVLNNPLAYVDQNGLWPTWIHNQIIREAFPGLSSAQLQSLYQASEDTDFNNPINGHNPQDPEASFVHGMSDGVNGQTVQGAQQLVEAFMYSGLALILFYMQARLRSPLDRQR